MLVIVHCLMLREQHTLLSYSEPEVKKKDPSAPSLPRGLVLVACTTLTRNELTYTKRVMNHRSETAHYV